jgi:hypothetical protein
MKKKIYDIYILILLFLILNLVTLVIQSAFSTIITPLYIVLTGALAVLIALSFTMEMILSLIVSGFFILIYAAYVFIQVFKGDILGRDALGCYIWFLILPIGSLMGSVLREKFQELEKEIQHSEENQSVFGLKDEHTLFYNKSEFISDLKIATEIFKNRKIYFSTILISINYYDVLIETLNKNQKEIFLRYFSDGLKKCTRLEEKKYITGDGIYAVITFGEGKDEVKEEAKEIKNYMEEYLKKLDIKEIEKITVKYSYKTFSLDYEDYLEYYKSLLKGLEYDV